MVIKQFKVGSDTKKMLLCLQDILTKELMEKSGTSSFEIKVEYGFILNEAVKAAGDISKIDFEGLLNKKVEIPMTFEKEVNGTTLKFRLRDGVSEVIDKATLVISEQLNGARVYRAMSVKLLLKNYLCIKTNQ